MSGQAHAEYPPASGGTHPVWERCVIFNVRGVCMCVQDLEASLIEVRAIPYTQLSEQLTSKPIKQRAGKPA